MTLRFLHSSDWQLGMTRLLFHPESQARYRDDQIAGVVRIGEVAAARDCRFVVVAGDVFDVVQPPRPVVARAFEALAAFPMPVYLLPGNHDPDSPAGLWRTSFLAQRCPPNVTVLKAGEPLVVADGAAEIVAVPWTSKKQADGAVTSAITAVPPPEPGRFRVLVAHGIADVFVPRSRPAGMLVVSELDAAVRDGQCHYVALGDRHSVTELGETGAVWYSGAPLATDFDEVDPNKALVVELAEGIRPVVDAVPIGAWQWIQDEDYLQEMGDVEDFAAGLADFTDKAHTVLRMGLGGTMNLSTFARLEEVFDEYGELFASLKIWGSGTTLTTVPDETDLGSLRLTGFAAAALEELTTGSSEDTEARDAVLLLHRLTRS